MIDEAFGLVQLLFKEFGKASLMERVGFIGTIATALLPCFFFFWRKYRLKDTEMQELDRLCKTRAELISKQKHEIDEQTKTINDQRSWFLDVRLKEVKKERQEGNEERAITILRTGVEAIRPDLATCCVELALHHLSLFSDYGVRHLQEAECMARMAIILSPSDQESESLLAEILAIESGVEYDRSNYQTSDNLWDEAVDFLKTGDNPQQTITALANTARQYDKLGLYRFAERLYRRLVIISHRVNGPIHQNTLAFRSFQAQSIGKSGKYFDALELSKALLPDQEKVLGKEHLDSLATRNNIAAWTGETGDAKQALELLKALLPDKEKVLGKEHSESLATRSNIASWTGEMGGAKQALELFKALLPDQEKVLDKEHPDSLTTCSNIAFWTGKIGDAKQALELLKALLPDQEKVLGKEHPNSLTTIKGIEHWQSIVDEE